MNISTKGRYALSYLTDLALCGTSEPLSVKESATHCQISETYLEQIVGILCKNKIVRGIKGPHGGYLLAVNPKQCTGGSVLRIMEGSLCVAPCSEDGGKWCERSGSCTNIILWKKIDHALNDVVDHITIEDMKNWKKEIELCDFEQ